MGDPEIAQHAQAPDGGGQGFLKAALVIIAVGVLLYGLILAWIAPDQPFRAIGPLLMPPVALLALILLRRGNVQGAFRVLAFGTWAVITFAAAFAGGVRAPVLFVYPILVVMSGWLLGLRTAMVTAVLTLVSAGAFLLAEQSGILPSVPSAPAVLIWLVQTITIVTSTVLIGFVLHRYAERFRISQALGNELSVRLSDLAAQERQLRMLAENIPAFIFQAGRDLRCRYANRRYAEFFGFTPESILGKSVADILGEESARAIRPRIDQVLSGETVRYRAIRRSSADGEEHHLDISFVPERDASGGVVGFYALKLDVTAEVLAEQALREQHTFQDALVQAQSDSGLAMFIIEGGRVVYANEAACRIYGYTREEFQSLPNYIVLAHPDDRERVSQNHQRRLRGEKFENSYRISIATKSGQRREVDMTVAFMAGTPPRVLVIMADATERVRAEKSLQESEARFRRLFEQVPTVAVQGYSPDGTVIYWNRANESVYGYTKEEALGRNLLDLIIPPAMREGVRAAVKQMTDSGQGLPAEELALIRKDGSTVPVFSSHVVLENALGEKELYCLDVDLTERKRIEEELRQSEHKFSRVFHNSPIPIAITRLADGRYVDINDAFMRLFGWTREEAVGRTSVELGKWLRPGDRQAWTDELRRTGRLEGYEIQLRGKEGRILPVLFSAELVELDGEQCVLVLAVDLSERKKTEAILADSEQRLREAQRVGHVGSWELDIATKRMSWSDELYRIYERSPSDFGGTWKDLMGLVHPEDAPQLREAWRDAAHAEGNFELRHRILTPGGRTKHLHVRFEVFRDDKGAPVRALGTAQDITEQVQARAEIEHLNERLEARVRERTAELQSANKELESFAYSISHDLRAPLRGIDGFGQLLLEEYGERLDTQGQDYLKRVRSAAQRMGTLIDDILELSRVTRKSMGREQVDLSRMAADILATKMKSDPQRRVETVVAPGCTATGDAQLLRVLLENLIENAWKYSRHADPARIEFGAERVDGETAYFVRDNGVGFDMKYAGRLFGPFQRLHKPEEFEGTGIGLASAARVVHRHGGRIWAEAEPGKGATFRFALAE